MSERATSGAPFVAPTKAGNYRSAARVAVDADLVAVVTRMAERLSALGIDWDASVRCSFEPDGDGCDTGHWIEIELEAGMVWADLTPWPKRFGGAIPDRLHDELTLAGWLYVAQGADPDPPKCIIEMVPELMTDEERAANQLPVRRLVTSVDEGGLGEWAQLLVDGARRVLAPRSDQWFAIADATELNGGRLAAVRHHGVDMSRGSWAIDLHRVMDPGDVVPAVWPAGSEGAWLACRAGLHEFHEPPCFEPQATEPLPVEPWPGL